MKGALNTLNQAGCHLPILVLKMLPRTGSCPDRIDIIALVFRFPRLRVSYSHQQNLWEWFFCEPPYALHNRRQVGQDEGFHSHRHRQLTPLAATGFVCSGYLSGYLNHFNETVPKQPK
jgi:hypothetical protein